MDRRSTRPVALSASPTHERPTDVGRGRPETDGATAVPSSSGSHRRSGPRRGRRPGRSLRRGQRAQRGPGRAARSWRGRAPMGPARLRGATAGGSRAARTGWCSPIVGRATDGDVARRSRNDREPPIRRRRVGPADDPDHGRRPARDERRGRDPGAGQTDDRDPRTRRRGARPSNGHRIDEPRPRPRARERAAIRAPRRARHGARSA